MKQAIIFFLLLMLSACAGKRPDLRLPTQAPSMPNQIIHQDGSFEGKGGLKLYQQSWRPQGSAKAALVIMHGLKDYSGHYQEAAVQLAAQGYAVYGFDLRGHGRSEGRRVYVKSFDDYIDDLSTFVEMVKKKEPGLPLFVFGHSMGGAIVTDYVLTKKPAIQGVLLSGPALQVGSDISPGLVKITKFLGKVSPRLPVLKLEDESFSRDSEVVKAMGTDPLIYQKKGPARTAAQLLKTIGYIQEHMEDFTLPVLIMHGTEDKLTNPEGSKALEKRASSTDKTLKLYQGYYHDLLHEPEKAAVLSDIQKWLDAHVSSSTQPAQ